MRAGHLAVPLPRLAGALIVAVALATTLPAAADGDYRTDSDAWNGLSRFASLATEAGYALETPAQLDWGQLKDGDVLGILYPTGVLDPADVAGYLRGGGRLLLADDFGSADAALARLHLLRRPLAATHLLHDDNPFLPLALPGSTAHPLAAGVESLITNHPAAFRSTGGPDVDVIFAFAPDEGVVVSGALGDGRFVAISDPSLFINAMLRWPGNRRLSDNVLAYLAPTIPKRRLILVAGAFSTIGAPTSVLANPPVAPSSNALLTDFGRFLDELNDTLAPAAALSGAALILAPVVVLVTLLWFLPWSSRERSPVVDLPLTVGRAAKRERPADFGDAARALRDVVLTKLADPRHATASRPPERALARLRTLPSGKVSRRRFLALATAVRPFLDEENA